MYPSDNRCELWQQKLYSQQYFSILQCNCMHDSLHMTMMTCTKSCIIRKTCGTNFDGSFCQNHRDQHNICHIKCATQFIQSSADCCIRTTASQKNFHYFLLALLKALRKSLVVYVFSYIRSNIVQVLMCTSSQLIAMVLAHAENAPLAYALGKELVLVIYRNISLKDLGIQ